MIEIILTSLISIAVSAAFFSLQNKKTRNTNKEQKAQIEVLRSELVGMNELRKKNKNLNEEIQKIVKVGVTNSNKIKSVSNESINSEISKRIEEIPKSVMEKNKKRQDIEDDISKAEIRRIMYEDSIRPSLEEVLLICHSVISNAIEQGLIGVSEISQVSIPDSTMTVSTETQNKHISTPSFDFISDFGTHWQVNIELGYVKSNEKLKREIEDSDYYYPMIRIIENSKPLLTLSFELHSLNLLVTSSLPSETDNINKITSEYEGSDAIPAVIAYLLKRIRLNEE